MQKLTGVLCCRSYERERLNERALFFRKLFITLGVGQAFVHLYKDYDRIDFIELETSPRQRLLKSATSKLFPSFMLTISTLIGFPFLYVLVPPVRTLGWTQAYAFFKAFYSLPKQTKPGGVAPLMGLLGRFLYQGFLLTWLWQFTNMAFDIYIAQEPLKNGHAITDDSKDPNGTLLKGLKSKKEILKVSLLALRNRKDDNELIICRQTLSWSFY